MLPQIVARNFQHLCLKDATNLLMELAVTIDAGGSFVKVCYSLEGDGPLALSCSEVLYTVRALIQVKHWPNTRALARRFAEVCQIPALEQQLITYALTCVQPGFITSKASLRENYCLVLKPFKLPVSFIPSRSQIFTQMLPQLKTRWHFHSLQGAFPQELFW